MTLCTLGNVCVDKTACEREVKACDELRAALHALAQKRGHLLRGPHVPVNPWRGPETFAERDDDGEDGCRRINPKPATGGNSKTS